MKITLRVEEDVPYTSAKIVMEAQITEDVILMPNLLAEVFGSMKVQVDAQVEKEMQSRGIALNDAGLIKEPSQN